MKLDLQEIGFRLKQFMDQEKIGVNELGRITESSGAQVSNIINGKNYGMKKFLAIAHACPNLNLYWLLTGEHHTYQSSNTEAVGNSIVTSNELEIQTQKSEKERSLFRNQIESLKLQIKSLEEKTSYQEMTISAYQNALSALSASNQDLKEIVNFYKNLPDVKTA